MAWEPSDWDCLTIAHGCPWFQRIIASIAIRPWSVFFLVYTLCCWSCWLHFFAGEIRSFLHVGCRSISNLLRPSNRGTLPFVRSDWRTTWPVFLSRNVSGRCRLVDWGSDWLIHKETTLLGIGICVILESCLGLTYLIESCPQLIASIANCLASCSFKLPYLFVTTF